MYGAETNSRHTKLIDKIAIYLNSGDTKRSTSGLSRSDLDSGITDLDLSCSVVDERNTTLCLWRSDLQPGDTGNLCARRDLDTSLSILATNRCDLNAADTKLEYDLADVGSSGLSANCRSLESCLTSLRLDSRLLDSSSSGLGMQRSNLNTADASQCMLDACDADSRQAGLCPGRSLPNAGLAALCALCRRRDSSDAGLIVRSQEHQSGDTMLIMKRGQLKSCLAKLCSCLRGLNSAYTILNLSCVQSNS